MNCPNCTENDLKVTDSRKHESCVQRVRVCVACGCIIRTSEEIYSYTYEFTAETAPKINM